MPTPPYRPVYRLTAYVAYSVDANEATVLTPAAGAAHSDPFVVASAQGIAGAKPYLGIPSGRMGALDPVTKKVTVSSLTVTLQDQRTTAGGDNAHRWLTAFLGDANGDHQLLHRKVYLEESLDGGSTWAAYFTGRINAMSQADPVRVTLSLRGIEAGLARLAFVGRPQSGITYAFLPNFTPVGLPQAWGGIQAATPLTGTFKRVGTTMGQITLTLSGAPSGVMDGSRALLFDDTWAPTGEEQVVITGGGVTNGVYNIRWVPDGVPGIATPNGASYFQNGSTWHAYWKYIQYIVPQASTAPGYAALPSDNATVTYYVTRPAQASEAKPLFIADVHPVQLMADLIDGKFSFLDATGAARPLAGRDATSFNNLIADTSIPTVRFRITQPVKVADFIEKYLCQPYGLGYRVNGAGQVVALDLRRSASVASGGTITDSDLAEPCPKWSVTEDGTYLGAAITHYRDRLVPADTYRASPDMFPVYPGGGVASVADTLLVLNPNAAVSADSADNILKIDAQGFRTTGGTKNSATTFQDDNTRIKAVERVALEILAPFAGGIAKLPLVCRRASAAAANCYPGAWRTVQVTTQPDPATNTRGGQRLMLCLSRTDQGPTTQLEMLDGGPGTVAVVPTFGACAVNADDNHAIDVALTQNAASDTAAIEYAITDTATNAAPGATDARWVGGGFVNQWSPSPRTIRQLPLNVRVWLRARSLPSGQSLELPSAYAYLGGSGYVQLSTIAAPSGLATANIYANRVDLSWVVGDATQAVEVYVTTGGVPGTWTDAMRVYALPAGSTGPVPLTGLSGTTQYTAGVRHRDAWGGHSAMATLTFTTGAAAATAPDPYGIDVCPVPVSLTPPTITIGQPAPSVTTGVALALYPSDLAYTVELERTTDSAGSPNVGAAATIASGIDSAQPIYVDLLPVDGTTYWYRLRHVGKGDTASNWTSWVSAKATALPPDVSPKRVVGLSGSLQITPASSGGRDRCSLFMSAPPTINNSTLTLLNWDSENFDVGGLHSGAAPSKITIPTGGDTGVWLLTANISFQSAAPNGGDRIVQIRKNGNVTIGQIVLPACVTGSDGTQISLTAYDNAPSVGAYYEVLVNQNSGVNVALLVNNDNSTFTALHLW